MYPEMLTVREIADLTGILRGTASYHTSHMRRLLKREYVRTPNKLHWEYKMTLKNPPTARFEEVAAAVEVQPAE